MKAILIAEKPSLMRSIQDAYNKHKGELNYEVDFLCQVGHLLGLKLPKEISADKYGKWSLSYMPELYPYEYKVISGKHDMVSKINTAINSGKYDFVIHAGDPDQEGELLVRLVLDYVGNTLPVKRFWSNDTTEVSCIKALKNLGDDADYDSWCDAALTRQHADYQFGMNATGIVSLKMGDLCKLGRVKAAIIALVAQKELDIKNYVEKITYKPIFDYENCEFSSDKIFDEKTDAEAYNPKMDKATVVSVNVENKKKKAPKLFRLSTLQAKANRELKFAPDETLKILQSLYESKAVSYPRSSCEYISSEVDIGGIAKNVLREIETDTSLLTRDPSEVIKDKTYVNDKAIASEGHTAIIPTGEGLSSSATAKEKSLYELICRQFLAIFAKEKETRSIKVVAIPDGSDKKYSYSESIDVEEGFELVLNPKYKKKEASGVSFTQGMVLSPIQFQAKECVSKPPTRYNGASIIEAMTKTDAYEDENGKVKYEIGTEATKASIVKECIENNYIDVKSNVYYATEKAEKVYAAFGDIPLFNPVESGRWESLLNHVRTGSMSAKEVEKELIDAMYESSEKMKGIEVEKLSKSGGESLGKCPHCGADVLKGKFGAYCSGKCGMTLGKYRGKALTDSQIKSLLAGKKVLVKGLTSKDGKSYDVNITPDGVESFSYTKKDGSTVGGLQWKFVTEFPQYKKK